MAQEVYHEAEPAKASLLYDPKVRGIAFQVILIALLVLGIWWIVDNTIVNLRRSNISTGFGFLRGRSGFDISDRMIDYGSDSSYGRALVVGILNTAVVAISGIITATIVGFLVGVGRLSNNWLIRKLAMVYVEVFRNIPPLLVILFWYQGVLALLPNVRDSFALPFGSFLNNRGFYFPRFVWGDGSWLILAGLLAGILLSWYVARRAYARQMATGQRFPVFWTSLALIVGMPLLGYFLGGLPVSMDFPQKGTFNLTGGTNVKPEFLSLFLALSFYTASFIAEIVRAGIVGVPKGQTEAYSALGLRSGQGLRLVVIPQAMRIIIPPLTSQYLNLTKNSSLAVAIGYPDLYAIGGTILNQTGQAIEVVVIFGIVYLGISIFTSVLMNWFNTKMALKER
ncbi:MULTISPECIES: amino acid ABC transporter permease [unclassified Mesorhizobium]|uniref:amino acid ABC transporter permease n=1 Tax=unclassified Mesorhizobium TaxID=325217 RepID=UPI0006F7BDAE|nr:MULTISPECIES: amino acid ABC transporter permease [unclassified Mesorhizobium]KQZ13530.1 amino acid ABC transporter permease [Mesorhizobium sp. Root1471]KQZ36042.1 amino acid ABC transporter permease [Mesorhizobium sp. Root554]MDR7032456.1 general L-amino acid transport system permease protein [Mesorhizobium sp. BE184]